MHIMIVTLMYTTCNMHVYTCVYMHPWLSLESTLFSRGVDLEFADGDSSSSEHSRKGSEGPAVASQKRLHGSGKKKYEHIIVCVHVHCNYDYMYTWHCTCVVLCYIVVKTLYVFRATTASLILGGISQCRDWRELPQFSKRFPLWDEGCRLRDQCLVKVN